MTSLGRRLRRNPAVSLGASILISFVILGLFAPWLSPYDPNEVFGDALRAPPLWSDGGSSRFPLGTDDLGRDVLSRLLHGARLSVGVGLLVVFYSLIAGVSLGLLAGYFGGWVDAVILRGVDLLMSLPSMLLAIVIVAILGPGLFNGILAVSVVALPGFIRLVRATVLAEKKKLYVEASRGFGAGHPRIALMTILPNCGAPILVQATLGFSDGILNVAALGFLGLGAQPPTAEWGAMLADNKAFMESSPWLVTLPGLCLLIAVLSFNLLGDGLRDVLDPKLRGR